MWRVAIEPAWQLARGAAAPLPLPALLRLLARLQAGGSIAAAARDTGISYRSAWGLLRDFERSLGAPLVAKTRGQGTLLAPLAEKLLWADRRVAARLSPTLESLASELESELQALMAPQAEVLRINASHGFAVAALVEALGAGEIAVDLKYRNSTEAVAALAHGQCDLAGFHVAIGPFEPASAAPFRQLLDERKHVLIHLAVRTQGLLMARGNPHRISSLPDLLRPGLRFVNRQLGSGTRLLLDLQLAALNIDPARINGYDSAEFTHAAVAAYIASGMADVGFGLEAAARRFQLDFVPLLAERYFLACDTQALRQPALQRVLALLRGAELRAVIDALPGYDGRACGELLTIEQAFARRPSGKKAGSTAGQKAERRQGGPERSRKGGAATIAGKGRPRAPTRLKG
jgi:molybdate transport repressor ModE-like protein